ncbi:MAG: ATP-binding protein [Kofleriaceae bacterium]
MDAGLSIALGCLAELLRRRLAASRRLGRTEATAAVSGLAIEPGELDRLLAAIVGDGAAAAPARPATSAGPGLAHAVPGFIHAQEVFGLDDVERDALFVAVAPELDARFARVFAFVNDAVVGGRPTVGLIAALFGPGVPPTRVLRAFLPDSAIARFGLATLERGGALAAQAIAVPPELWPRLVGLDVAACDRPTALTDLVLDDDLRARADHAAAWWQPRPDGVLVVEGPAGSGREALARAIAAAAGLHTRTCAAPPWPSATELARDARWHRAAAVVVDPPATVAAAALAAPAPVAIVTAAVAGFGLAGVGRPALVVPVPAPTSARRRQLWQRALPAVTPDDAATLAGRFQLGPARIAEVVARARDASSGEPDLAGLARAAVTASRLRLDGLATPVATAPAPPLVVPTTTRRELELAEAWAASRRSVLGAAGVGCRLGLAPGLVCLFWGQPGTGKSLAARHLAAAAGVDLYRVDLAQVVSKYIGETEKQLALLMDECERGDLALLFDEADALFGKRTEIRDAHDRYANIETGYLLQRLETTTALIILTSNLRQNLDAAFARRLHVTAEFPPPRVDDRVTLWRNLLPDGWAAHVDLAYLAGHELRGGEIRNAVAAALLAMAPPTPDRAMPFLVWGVWRELHKTGRLVIAAEFGRWAGFIDLLARGAAVATAAEREVSR